MFGYVRAESQELRVREYEYYRGAYCGLCRAMGKCTGQCSRLTLNYDILLLALSRTVLLRDTVRFEQKRCAVHPLKKRNVMKRNEALDFSASISAILTYYKVRDDILDKGAVRSLITRLFVLPFAAHARKKALKRMPALCELDEKILQKLKRLSSLEKERIASVDIPAEIFGELLSDVLSFGIEGNEKRIAENIGKSIGKWIYIADALDDMEDDVSSGNYNPLIEIYDGKLPSPEQRTDVASALKNELFSAERALELIDFEGYDTVKSILFNIIYLGMSGKIDRINDPHKK